MPISKTEHESLVSACQQLPTSTVQDEEKYVSESPVLILMSTVLSLNRGWYSHALPARRRFESNLYSHLSPPSLAKFSALLTRVSRSETDWVAAANAMWATSEARKAKALSQLTQYLLVWFASNCPADSDLDALRHWAAQVSKDAFVGKIKHLGPRAHEQLLWYIEGTQAIKLDRHVIQFVSDSIGRTPPETEMINSVKAAAAALRISPTELDARIWDYMQGKSKTKKSVSCQS
jgi:hypothetical protein